MASEKWERTKRYLFRNLLVDPGYRLSPVTEESISDNLVDGPYSPLPDLIIEPEPNRHDELPEFYQGLEVRMRRLYKKLFVEDRESSVETEGLINVYEEIRGLDVKHTTRSTFSHHREVYRETSTDSEILHPNNILKEIQNVPKIVETKNKPSVEEFENSPIISFGRIALSAEDRANVTNLSETDLDFTHVISNGDSKENKEMQNKSKSLETEEQSKSENYYRRAVCVENISNETELTELDMDFTLVISTRNNESEELQETENKNNSSKTEDDQSVLGFGNSITFGKKTVSVDENKTTETELTVSDVDDTHVILTTVVEIHEEPLSGKTFVFETASPVLISTRHKASSDDFRVLTENTGNISLVDKAKNKNKPEHVNQTDFHNVENINDKNEREATVDQSNNELDLEVENILQNAEAVSNFDRMCDVGSDSEKSEEVSSKGEDLFAFLKESRTNTEIESASDEMNEDTIRSNGRPRKRSRDTEYDTDNSFEMAVRKCVFERLSKRKTSDQSSEVEIKTEEESRGEERIDSKEYDAQRKRKELTLDYEYRDISNDDEYGSFELAIRLEAFQRINRRKGFGQAPKALDSTSDETEVVEEMRGAPQVEPLQVFPRKSTASQESLQGLFAKPSIAEIPEDISIGVEEHNISNEALNRTREEKIFQNSPVLGDFTAHTHTVAGFPKNASTCDKGDMNMSQEDNRLGEECVEEKKPVFGGSYIAHKHKAVHFQANILNGNEQHVNVSPARLQEQNSSQEDSVGQMSSEEKRTSTSKTKPAKSFPDEVKESSVSTEEATPSAPAGNNLMSTLCGEIWSVSPIPINTADFSNATSSNTEVSNENLAAKRRQISSPSVPNKRKKCQNKSVQAGTERDPWEALKSNFFVGTPRIFKLCSCSDHTCP